MIKVKISNNFPVLDLFKQTPDSLGIFENCQFFVNDDIEECDYWVVYEGLLKEEKTICPKKNLIFITGEPTSIRLYNEFFLNQFSQVITCQQELKHKNKIMKQQALPWHMCLHTDLNYNYFKNVNPEKTKLISVITSNKVITEGHKKRLDFVMALKDHFGDKIDVFGRGIRDIDSKWDAIAPYKYHIALENSAYPDYWTEKLADCYLGGAYPLYYGCPNLSDYFDEKSFIHIDINNVEASIKVIEEAITNNQYEKSVQNIQEAKNLVLDKYNLFAIITKITQKSYGVDKQKELIKLKPETYFPVKKRSLLSKFLKRTKELNKRLWG